MLIAGHAAPLYATCDGVSQSTKGMDWHGLLIEKTENLYFHPNEEASRQLSHIGK
jgi:hypothetical protein